MSSCSIPDSLYWLDSSFGNYLAGLTAGEGSFGVRNSCVTPCFSMFLRADDRDILYEIQRKTNLGSIYYVDKKPTPGRNNKPQYCWSVQNLPHCLALCDIFTRFPLRNKKARDFEIWKQIVLLKKNPIPGSFKQLLNLETQLKEGRKYENSILLVSS